MDRVGFEPTTSAVWSLHERQSIRENSAYCILPALQGLTYPRRDNIRTHIKNSQYSR
jgi:hypothetical protein